MPSDHSHFPRGEIEESIIENLGNDHNAAAGDGYPRRTTLTSKIYHTKGSKGAFRLSLSHLIYQKCI
jgi:dickkopf